ncbi:hypothetical protein [uncultured Cellulomonas sp.]|uniref:hypothetical protein n=1 Tax=uncultured Cellulomonas sp. TaxID=189682 RepID=UPI0026335FC6|nr:hypothetical protein [uncultured Cellulomonas sp.]
MHRIARSLLTMVAAPVVAATVLVTPAAQAWTAGGGNLLYEFTDQREKTTIAAATRSVSGYDEMVTDAQENCAAHAAYYKRYNYLSPTTVLLQIGMTNQNLCGYRGTGGYMGSQGNVTVFGNFKAVTSVYPLYHQIRG